MTDDYILNDDGTVTFDLGGTTRVLKRPTLRQYRTAIESLGSLSDAVLEPEASRATTIHVQLDVVVNWFDTTFLALSGEGFPRTPEGEIDEDQLPAWLLGADIIAELIAHWQQRPNPPGRR